MLQFLIFWILSMFKDWNFDKVQKTCVSKFDFLKFWNFEKIETLTKFKVSMFEKCLTYMEMSWGKDEEEIGREVVVAVVAVAVLVVVRSSSSSSSSNR